MRRIPTFVFGMIAGAFLVYGALHYHVIRTSDGLHLLEKRDSTLAAAYVDLRSMDMMTLVQRYPRVAEAIAASGRNDLIGAAASDSINSTIDRVLASPPGNR